MAAYLVAVAVSAYVMSTAGVTYKDWQYWVTLILLSEALQNISGVTHG